MAIRQLKIAVSVLGGGAALALAPLPSRPALADPVQQIWDLHDLGGADRVEAADRLTAAVLDGKLAVGS